MSEEAGPVILPEGYYLRNFNILLEHVLRRYEDLLTDDEKQFVFRFQALSNDAQKLFVRLVSRKGPWFRAEKLAYSEITGLSTAIEECSRHEFLHAPVEDDVLSLLECLTSKEVRELTIHFVESVKERRQLFPATLKKDELVAAILNQVPKEQILKFLLCTRSFVRPAYSDVIPVFRLLFFGNLSQDMTEFVLEEMGLTKYEPYSLSLESRSFRTRVEIDQRLTLKKFEDRMEEFLGHGFLDRAEETAQELLVNFQNCVPRLSRRRDRILNMVGKALEQAGELERALRCYEVSNESPARERLVRILFKLGRKEEARLSLERMLEEPKNEAELEFAQSFLRRSYKETATFELMNIAWEVKELELEKGPGLSVEAHVIKELQNQGLRSLYSENHLWRSLFGLVFWDIIFADVQGAFHHPFQSAPSDIFSKEFREKRSDLILERLEKIRNNEIVLSDLVSLFHEKKGTANLFVDWFEGFESELIDVYQKVGGPVVASVFERMLSDLKQYGSGFPDLFVFGERGAELWEVKGPGDQLRPTQKGWLTHFAKCGVPVVLCRVKWKNSITRDLVQESFQR